MRIGIEGTLLSLFPDNNFFGCNDTVDGCGRNPARPNGWLKPYKPYKQWDKPPVYMIMPTIQYSMPGLHAVG